MEGVGDGLVAGKVHVELRVKGDSLKMGSKCYGQSSFEHEK